MSNSKQQEETAKSPKVDLMPKYALQRKCFTEARIRDVKTGKWSTWPYIATIDQISFERWLGDVTDPDTGYFYPKRDKKGNPIKTTTDNIPEYKIQAIVRLKRMDNSEFLVSKGIFIGYNNLGDMVRHFVSKPESWNRTDFKWERQWNDNRKMLEHICMDPSGLKEVYTMPFNEKNLKELFDKRENDHIISFSIRDEKTGNVKAVEGVNIQETYQMFLKEFRYLFNADYLTPQQKALIRQEAYDRGFIKSPGEVHIPDDKPPKDGTYT